MDWKSVVSKNSDKIIENIKKEPDIIVNNDDKQVSVINYLDVDTEFDFKYISDIYSIKEEFKEFIDFHILPFMEEDHRNFKFNFIDFIKNNSKNYLDIEKKVFDYNNNLDKEFEEEYNEDDILNDSYN